MFKECEPKFIENSKLPGWLSKIAPITIGAVSIAFWVFGRGALSKTTRRHETIHYQQQIELLFIGQWILYGLFHLIGLVRYRDGATAYRENPFEREAYANEDRPYYLFNRKRYCWWKIYGIFK